MQSSEKLISERMLSLQEINVIVHIRQKKGNHEEQYTRQEASISCILSLGERRATWKSKIINTKGNRQISMIHGRSISCSVY